MPFSFSSLPLILLISFSAALFCHNIIFALLSSRVKSMLEQRRILTSERKKAAATLRMQKENVCKIMEVVRSDASKASRIISLAISGKLPLKDLASGNLVLRGASADNTRKRKGEIHNIDIIVFFYSLTV
jgi:hypothetical protein